MLLGAVLAKKVRAERPTECFAGDRGAQKSTQPRLWRGTLGAGISIEEGADQGEGTMDPVGLTARLELR